MKFAELKLNENYNLEDDKLSPRKRTDHRRPRLTLKHLNRLRKIRELKKYEDGEHKELISLIYSMPAAEETGGM